MAERVPFNPEEVRAEKNVRPFQNDDFVWCIPDPDEDGMVDPDMITLYQVVSCEPENAHLMCARPIHVVKVPKANLYLGGGKANVAFDESAVEGIQ